MDNKSVLVGMSGGLDSAIAAHRLINEGYEVSGIYLKSWKWDENDLDSNKLLPWLNILSNRLGIDIEIVEREDLFKNIVINRYITLIQDGFTPNPCVLCNPFFKFKLLSELADEKNIKNIATGHYAINTEINGEWKVFKGIDSTKDQSYVLCLLNQKILSRTLLPLGSTTKNENRNLANEIGLDFSNIPESQDLCFVKRTDHRQFLEKFIKNMLAPGEILDTRGMHLGRHQGLALYTIGQRKGIQISANQPYYVVKKDLKNNTLIIGLKDELGSSEMIVNGMNWISGKRINSLECDVKIRYHSNSHNAIVEKIEKDKYKIKFFKNIPDLTPGQFAVLYDRNEMLGGGMILEVIE